MPRPHFQFRLSTLLWFTLAVACWFGGMRFQEYRHGPSFKDLDWSKISWPGTARDDANRKWKQRKRRQTTITEAN
jgi:hypothetical protein